MPPISPVKDLDWPVPGRTIALLYSRTIDNYNNLLRKQLEFEDDITSESKGF